MRRIGVDFVVELRQTRCTTRREGLPHCAVGARLWAPGEDAVLIDHRARTGCGTGTIACSQHALDLQTRHSR